jgi:hypothetical protein
VGAIHIEASGGQTRITSIQTFTVATMNIRTSFLQPLKHTPNIPVCRAFVVSSSLYIPPLLYQRGRVTVRVMLRPTVSRPFCLGISYPSGAYDQIFITVRHLLVC